MRHRLQDIAGYLVTLLGGLGLVHLLLRDRLWQLGDIMLFKGGDPLKNIFTPSYLYKWDDGVWHSAMNYPYGEYAVYTDAQVRLVQILRFLRFVGIDSEDRLLLGIVS